MHFKCTRCPNEFCSGCGGSFKQGQVGPPLPLSIPPSFSSTIAIPRLQTLCEYVVICSCRPVDVSSHVLVKDYTPTTLVTACST